MDATVHANQIDRKRFLQCAYELSGGDPSTRIEIAEPAKALALDPERVRSLARQLRDAGLVEIRLISLKNFRLTAAGNLEAEATHAAGDHERSRSQGATMRKVFLSHASADRALVDAFVDLLQVGIGIPHDSVFCSSLKGQGIPTGKDFKEHIRTSLADAPLVVALISPSFYASAFCMCELGATWVQAKEFVPLLIPPLGYSELKAVLQGVQASKLDSQEDLDDVRDRVAALGGFTAVATPRWNQKRDEFLNRLPAILKTIKAVTPVSLVEHQRLIKELAEYRAEYEKREQEIAELNATIDALKKTKDAKAVADVLVKRSGEWEQFEALRDAAKTAMSSLPAAVERALFYHYRGEDYSPGDGDYDSAKEAVESGYLRETEGGFVLDRESPPVQEAVEALDAFQEFVSGSRTQAFDEQYFAGFHERPKFSIKPFWQRHFGVRI